MSRVPRKCRFCNTDLTPDDSLAWAASGLPAGYLCCSKCVPAARKALKTAVAYL